MLLQTEVTKTEPDITVVKFSGRLTLGNSLQMAEFQMNSLVEGGARKVIFDMADVNYIDSAGLGMVMQISGKLRSDGGHLRIAAIQEPVSRVLEMTQTSRILAIDGTRDEAIRQLQGTAAKA